MADQYQNFSNPTIIPEQKYGLQGFNQSLQSLGSTFGDMLKQRWQAQQALQLDQAQTLSKYQTMYMLQTGQRHPGIDALLSQNPYGQALAPKGSQPSTNPMPQGNSPSMGATLGGNMSMGSGGAPTMSGVPGGFNTPAVSTPVGDQSLPGGPVITGSSQSFAPFGDLGPKYSTSSANPSGEAQVAAAKDYAGSMATSQAKAQEGTARDVQQLGMIKSAMQPIVDSYNDVYNGKVAGVVPAGGDKYGSTIVKNADFIPRAFGLQSKVVPNGIQNAAGKFLSNKNELITKLQPLLSQQFGAQGSSRIMESLLNMSKSEIGDLNTPKAQFEGQVEGTLRSMYRIAKASEAYQQDLAASGQPAPDPETAAQQIFQRMQLQKMSPDEEKTVSGMVDDVLGRKAAPSSGNPVGNQFQQGQQTPPPQAQSKPLDVNTARQILMQAGGDKNKARQIATQMGYKF